MKDTKPKVSIIVPVYNVEKYLRRCMDSLINQTFKDIEIIAINDGSTDKSIQILQEYKEKDSRVKIIDKENTGVSDSRNKGIKTSNGEYILFVDSDDWIDLDMIDHMYENAKKNESDLVMCSYVREFKNHSKEKLFNLDEEVIYEKDKVKELNRKIIGPINDELSNPEGLDSLGTIWAKLYKSQIIKKYSHRFIDLEEIGSAEDTLFNIFIFKNIDKVTFLNKPYYHYWKGNKSSLTSGYNPNLKLQWNKLFSYIRHFIDNNKLDEEFYEALDNRIAMCVLGLGLNECNKKNKQPLNIKVINLRNILNDSLIRTSYRNFQINRFPIHWRLFYIFNKNKMAIPSFCMLNVIEFMRTRV